jgi:hypothetical protein
VRIKLPDYERIYKTISTVIISEDANIEGACTSSVFMVRICSSNTTKLTRYLWLVFVFTIWVETTIVVVNPSTDQFRMQGNNACYKGAKQHNFALSSRCKASIYKN